MDRAPIERILCPVDFSDLSVQACEYADSLAQHYRAALFLQHVVELWRHPSACFVSTADQYEQYRRELLTAAKDQLRDFVKAHLHNGIRPECVIQEGAAPDSILSFAEQHAASLIVIATHGTHGLDRLMLGSITEKILRTAHCSVLALRQTSRKPSPSPAAQPGIELREILYCTDFSDAANNSVDYARSVAAEYHAHLTALHVIDGIAQSRGPENMARACACLNQLMRAHGGEDPGITAVVRTGSACKEISRLACEKDADLVIMTVRGHQALDDRILGSTTYRVLQLVNCPVLAVHPSA